MDKAYLILLFPLLSFVVGGIFLNKKPKAAAGFSIAMAALSLASALMVAFDWWSVVSALPEGGASKAIVPWAINWLPLADNFSIGLSIYLDPISVMMLVVITVIALLVNIYSVGYLRGDSGFPRFFAELSLFAFSMLGLVSAGNLFQMFIFWELVGVSSYLLIGFWYHKPSAVAASKKAFIITRFADSFFLLGIVLISYYTGSFEFSVLNTLETAAKLATPVNLGLFSASALTIGTLFVFAGGWGKSAMFPLHVWLPDAMEGPTPVSSIIHSATMVVAGVYLTARMFPLFASAADTLQVVEFVGALTAIFAAIIACTQKDIKRILAFSTLSQLGYMMFSLGTSYIGPGVVNELGYSASMFHVFSHAFFKCMLFLGAGALIHAVHSNDLDQMGGLRKKMPFTFASMLLATIAIAGIPPLSGFWSKDEILVAAWQSQSYVVFGVGLVTGGLTAFYMFRMFFLAFFGKSRAHAHHDFHGHDKHPQQHHEIHEDPWMTVPIVLLTIPTVFAGFFSKGIFERIFKPNMVVPAGEFAHATWIPYAATFMGVLGVGIAWFLYGQSKAHIAKALNTEGRPAWYRVVMNKFYFDEVYLWITRKLIIGFAAEAMKVFDHLVDTCVDLSATFTQLGGRATRALQSGALPLYIGLTLFGILFIRYLGHLPL
jgi:NADH-quinone oxidoreductase subunit L